MGFTKSPGATISFKEALVLTLMHALQSGRTDPSRIPGFTLICLRTSSIIPKAARPTDFMVSAEKAQGIMAPNKRLVKIIGSSNESQPCFKLPMLQQVCMKAPQRAKPTKVADPIANPLPMAAVVFPAESKTSVLCLTLPQSYAISAIPPALSLMGPQPSIARQIGRFESMPRAASATPQQPRFE